MPGRPSPRGTGRPGGRPAGVAMRSRGRAPLRAQGARGSTAWRSRARDGSDWVRGKFSRACDLVLVSGGWSPVVNLLSHRGIKPVWDAENALLCARRRPASRSRWPARRRDIWRLDDCAALRPDRRRGSGAGARARARPKPRRRRGAAGTLPSNRSTRSRVPGKQAEELRRPAA